MIKKYSLLRRRTKIVCTIGPASGSTSVIEDLVRSGMNVARLNLSHGTQDIHSQYVSTLRRMSQRLGKNVSLLIDLPGQKCRTGKFKGGEATIRRGSQVILTAADVEGDATVLPVNLPGFIDDVSVGDKVLVDDGAMQLKVVEKKDGEVSCRVVVGGLITEGRGLVVPGMLSSGPFINDALRENVRFAIEQKPDYLAVSFVSNQEDILSVRELLKSNGAEIPLISKIERVHAVRNFDDILSVSDGIMVARGDLGVDIPMERVPLVQKEIIYKCNRAGKPVITATQMLESMVNAPRPTRAEVADVANAIFDGTDAIMLSAETSIGKYPVGALRMMARIARETEKKLSYESMLKEREDWIERQTGELISYNACHTAHSLSAVAIVAFTQSGSTAKRVSKYRPRVPILAITPDNAVSGRLALHWGVYPFMAAEASSSLEHLFTAGVKLARELGLARAGSKVVITGGVPIGVTGTTNLLKVEKLN